MFNLSEDKIIIYGAGCCGAIFAELLLKSGLHAECFFDKSSAKTGKRLMGIEIKQPVLLDVESLVVVCILKKGKLYEEIARNLRQLGYQKILHIYDLRDEAWLFEEQSLVFAPHKKEVQENLSRYENLRRHLSDELSCHVLDCIMRFLLEDADIEFPAFEIKEQYFAYDIYQKIKDESVIDCGAFRGDVMRIFLEKNENHFVHYLAIEPDIAYLPFLQYTANEYENGKIEIKNCALSDKQENLRMRNYAQEDSIVCIDGEIQVEAYPLDDLLEDRVCTFLKIDVEGYDKNVILGAKHLICEQKPVVAVAAYHHEADFYEIFELLQSIYPKYRFYLRSYMNFQETILYAVPPWRLVKEEENEIYR